ncbi:hypothetical protein HX093_01585 [Myroides marinus]|uniref:hypothetical protein n=2 Tax=Myroides marinus TaxID=703342 RepID=UPI002576AA19|nr:hypothetical protein [Myroides marinus]MDM1531322.1 hypothetical protein [Myroides marinus]MDM1538530.1 hypothetical protein [Myroides marinus]
MMNRILRISFILLVFVLTSCKNKPTNTMASFYTGNNVECISADMYGNEIVQVFAQGRNRSAAIAEAKEEAIKTVMFRGIVTDKKQCSVKPIVKETNAEERYKKYFDKFFKKGGKNRKYTSVRRIAFQSNVIKNGITYESYSVEVTVNRKEIEKRLVKDEIIKINSYEK